MRGRYLCAVSCLLLLWFVCAGRTGGGNLPPPAPEGDAIRVLGTVYRQEITETSQRIYLKNISFYSQTAESLPETKNWKTKRVIVYLKDEENIRIGSHVAASGVCSYPSKPRNPGGFDQAAYYGGMGVGMLLGRASILWKDDSVYPLRDAIWRFQAACRRQLVRIGEKKDAGVLSAMLLGDRGILSEETKELYQDAGIIHLLAVSGLHISLTGMALYHLLRRLGLSFGFSGILSGTVMALYACMTGAVSAVRAVLMFGLFLLSQITGRTYDLPTSLGAAAVSILLVRNTQIGQAGFLLSFGAVCGVILASAWSSRLLRGSAFGISLGVQLTTLPLTAYFYYQFPPYAVLVNLCVIWMMPFVLGFGMAGIAASAVSLAAGRFLLAPAHYLLAAAEWLCGCARLLPSATLVTGQPKLARMVFYYAALAGMFLLKQSGQKISGWVRTVCGRPPGTPELPAGRRALPDILVCFCASLLFLFLFSRGPEGFQVTFLDVGQGDGCCIENAGDSVWMVDGGSSDEEELETYCLEPFLKSRGIGRVDWWLISHGDADHISGLLAVLRSYVRAMDGRNAAGLSVGTILLPEANLQTPSEGIAQIEDLARKLGIAVRFVKKGTTIQDGEMTVRILSPDETIRYEDTNAASAVAQISYGKFSALLTGDVQGEGEKALIESGLLKDVDVLKTAHHGSRNSTPAEFLELVRPELAVISCGRDNSYGHPHEELLRRLAGCGCEITRTDLQGAVTVRVTRDGYEAVSEW